MVSFQINQVTENLGNVKPPQVKQILEEENKFRHQLNQSMQETSNFLNTDPTQRNLESQLALQYGAIPSWVDPVYGFDPLNPRKPHMREIMEAMSGSSVEELYQDPACDWLELSSQASEILYGVTATVHKDTRNWEAIMGSNSIIDAARIETGAMLEPQVKIKTNYNHETEIAEQFAVLNDKNGKVLRTLVGPARAVERTLLDFGATKSSIPKNLISSVDLNKFDKDIFNLLEGYKGNAKPLSQIGRKNSVDLFIPGSIDSLQLNLIKTL